MVGIIFLLNIEYAPYLKKYTEQLEKRGQQYEIITWNRLNSDIPKSDKIVAYEKKGELGDSKFHKLFSFFGYRSFLIKTLREKKYEKLIILTTLTGMLVADYLLKNYKDKYIFDIRDYTFEKKYIYKYIEKKIVDNSYFTSISSEGFKEFLPQSSKYVISHNFINGELEEAEKIKKIRKSGKINLVFIGAVRHFEIDKKVVDIFGNDERYNIYFHGYGKSYEQLKAYCNNKFENVYITGKYERSDKIKLLSHATVINSYYSENEYANHFALSNKYYDSLIYRIPLWANEKLYIGKRSIERGIGLKATLDTTASDRLFNEVMHMDWNKFEHNCSNELEIIIREDEGFNLKLNEFIDNY